MRFTYSTKRPNDSISIGFGQEWVGSLFTHFQRSTRHFCSCPARHFYRQITEIVQSESTLWQIETSQILPSHSGCRNTAFPSMFNRLHNIFFVNVQVVVFWNCGSIQNCWTKKSVIHWIYKTEFFQLK